MYILVFSNINVAIVMLKKQNRRVVLLAMKSITKLKTAQNRNMLFRLVPLRIVNDAAMF